MDNYTIALLQLDTGPSKAVNLAAIQRLASEAAAQGAAMLCLPEWSDVIAAPLPAPEPLSGATVAAMATLAQKHGVWLHLGSFHEENPKGKPFNTSVLLNPSGNVAAVYRKLHLFDVEVADGPAYLESAHTSSGDSIATLQTPLGHLGFSICYDLRFPEQFRTMALAGSQVLFVPSCFTHETGKAHWETLLRARAIENGCYVVAAAQTGQKPAYAAHGHSMVIDPWGAVLARAGREEGFILATIHPGYSGEVRAQIPNLNNRRPEVYRLF